MIDTRRIGWIKVSMEIIEDDLLDPIGEFRLLCKDEEIDIGTVWMLILHPQFPILPDDAEMFPEYLVEIKSTWVPDESRQFAGKHEHEVRFTPV